MRACFLRILKVITNNYLAGSFKHHSNLHLARSSYHCEYFYDSACRKRNEYFQTNCGSVAVCGS